MSITNKVIAFSPLLTHFSLLYSLKILPIKKDVDTFQTEAILNLDNENHYQLLVKRRWVFEKKHT